MMGSMMRRAITSGGTDHLRAKTFIADAKSGADSVDFLISGDSNTNIGGWGWCDALNYAMQQSGSKDYATPLVPALSRENANYYGVASKFDSYSYVNASETITNAAGTGSMGGTLAKGTSANSSDLYSLLSRSSGSLQPNASPFNYGYIASGNWADFIGGIYMVDENSNVLPWVGSAITYRVVHGVGPSMGTFRLVAKLNVPPYTTPATATVSCTAGAYNWITSTLSLSADSGRTGVQWKFGYAESSPYNMTGPVALAFHSVCRSVKGHCVQSLDHYGGATTKQVADNAVGAPLVIKQYMREIRARQIACGGTGRLIVMFQGGVNGTGSSTWATDCTAFMETCRTCWSDLGYPAGDIAFLGLTSHQKDSTDGMTTLRASAATLAGTYTIVDGMAIAPYSALIAGNYYKDASTERQHLNEAGYKWACGQLLAALA